MSIKKIFLNPYIVAFLFGILGLHLVREFSAQRFTPPAPLVHVPAWELVNEEQNPFGSKELAGKVVIANFMFTRCPTICPKLTQAMTEVRKRFINQLDKTSFLSISIDPEFDTPEILSQYKKKHQIDWSFLTGTKEKVYEVIEGKMKLPVSEGHHVAELVLFDQAGDLR